MQPPPCFFVFFRWPAIAAPVITFESQAVVAQGLTPNGQAVWFSYARARPSLLDADRRVGIPGCTATTARATSKPSMRI